jgi:hypothetical protein
MLHEIGASKDGGRGKLAAVFHREALGTLARCFGEGRRPIDGDEEEIDRSDELNEEVEVTEDFGDEIGDVGLALRGNDTEGVVDD